MDFSGIIDFINRLINEIILRNIGKIAVIAVTLIVILTLLRIFIPMIWENILVGIIKLSDKKTKNEKEDE